MNKSIYNWWWASDSYLLDSYYATAAYSLRRLSKTYTGPVIRVRRSSDDTEQDIFLSGKSIDIAALNSFVIQNVNTYTSNFSSGVDSNTATNGTLAGNIDNIGGQDNNLRFTINSSTGIHAITRANAVKAGEFYNISYKVYIPSSNSLINKVGIYVGGSKTGVFPDDITTTDTWVSVTSQLNTSNVGGALEFYGINGTNTSYTGNGTDVFYIKDVSLTIVGGFTNGHIRTWYDQSLNGSNAVQTDITKQPKIISGGLLQISGNAGKPTLVFDGVNDGLDVTTNKTTFTSAQYGLIFSGVGHDSNPTTKKVVFSASTDTTDARIEQSVGNTSMKLTTTARRLDSDSAASITSTNSVSLAMQVYTSVVLWASSDAYQYINGTLDGSSTSFLTDGYTSPTDSNTITIGHQQNTNNINGRISEIVIFVSDYTATRESIESNIKSYYGI